MSSRRGDDMVAVEVHRKALENITNEMGITLIRTSGSPVVTESKDFAACLLDTGPEHLSAAAYIVTHFGTSLVGTQVVAEMAAERGDLRPGDGFIVNDPYRGGANHQGDVGIIMPMFHGTTHVGWGFTNMHMLDVGGAGVSGVAPGARDVFGEGLRFGGVRAIRDGAIDPEWEDFIANNVRVPGPVLNDIRSMISGINVGNRKLSELIADIGLERHVELCEINKDLTERVLRERISKMPDGVYEAVEWNEFDARDNDLIQQIHLSMEVDGSDLHFRYRGDPQIEGFANCGYGGMLGSMMVGVLTTLCWGDLPMNGGLWRPLHLDVGEPGTVINPTAPAPVSFGHAEVGMRVRKLSRATISQALAVSDDPVLRSHINAKAHDGPNCGPILFGPNQHGGRSVMVYADVVLTGGGAATNHDGQDGYGTSGTVGVGLTELETHEAADPVLFLWRTVAANSGGPGQTRGGQSIDQAYRMEFVDTMGGPSQVGCAEVPASGVGGGYPGGAGSCWILRGDDAIAITRHNGSRDAAEILQRVPPIPSKVPDLDVRRGEVVVLAGGGGGGMGDPLLRAPALVAEDVRSSYITAEHAEAAYGVVLDAAGGVDAAATDDRRARIRHERLGAEPTEPLSAPAEIGVSVVIDDGAWVCGSCGETLGAMDANWRDTAVLREGEISARYAELKMHVRPRVEPPIVMREYFCPSCAQALIVDVVTQGYETAPAPRLAAGVALVSDGVGKAA
jgi:N-methylhydantoinase B